MSLSNRDFIFVKATSDYYSIHKVWCEDIIAFEAKRNHVVLHLASGNLTTYIPISVVAELFSHDPRFVQQHRSFIIAIKHIKLLRRSQIVMIGGLTFMVGDMYNDTFNKLVSYHLLSGKRSDL